MRPVFAGEFDLEAARHPLLELRLRENNGNIIPLNIALPATARQMIISGPNTGGKTVALKTAGLLIAMAQAGVPVPAERASLPLFTALYADIGDAQSIEQNLSTFSAHIVNVDRISRVADKDSLVLLDELGSATDPEEGAALAVAVAKHFLARNVWCFITTHLTALKVYAANREGVFNAAVGFDEETLSPTYDLRLGVPGASAGLNIAERLGLDRAIVADAPRATNNAAGRHRPLPRQPARANLRRRSRARSARRNRAQAPVRAPEARSEGRAEQQARTKELRKQLEALIEDFEGQLRDTVKAIDDKAVARKLQRDAAVRVAGLRREFSEKFQSTVVAYDPGPKTAKPAERKRDPQTGDTVRLKSLGREGRVVRVIDAKNLEVQVGAMKTRVPLTDIAEVTAAAKPLPTARTGGVSVSSGGMDADYVTSEINVIGKTVDEAEGEVERFLEHAFLAGLPRIRIVHGVGMGILRRALRDMLKKHPHVTSVSEPPYNEGGQGATLVEMKQ